MRKEIDKIEIKEPPLEELSKKRSCFKRTCFTGCGCVVILFIISLVFLKLTLGPKSKELKDLPEKFSSSIPVYDPDSIEVINYTAGKDRSTSIEKIAYLPKLIVSPAILWLERENKNKSTWEKFNQFMKKPVTDQRDIIEIEWKLLPADVDFILDYYKNELKRQSFMIGLESKTDEIKQFTFKKDNIDGALLIKDFKNTPQTDYMDLKVNINISN